MQKMTLKSLLLGGGLGLSHLTSFRFLPGFGWGEILILCYVLIGYNYYREIFRFSRDFSGFFRLAFAFSCTVLVFNSFYSYAIGLDVDFIYIFSYWVSFLVLSILLFDLSNGLDVKIFFISFMTVFILSYFSFSNFRFDYFITHGELGLRRDKAGAFNPNQILFYLEALFLLTVLYRARFFLSLFLFLVLFVIAIMIGSDTGILMFLLFFVGFFIFKFRDILFRDLNIVYYIFFVIVLFSLLIFIFFDFSFFQQIWLAADEGNTRILLAMNGIHGLILSPLFGFGLVAISGLSAPLSGWEAHNTFIDLAGTFGIPFAILVYVVFF